MKKYCKLALRGALILGLPIFYGNLYASQEINLEHQKLSLLQSLITKSLNRNISLKEIRRSLDLNKTLHVRVQEEYEGYKVWGADAVIHIPNGEKVGDSINDVIAAGTANPATFLNGMIYDSLQLDLAKPPQYVFKTSQAEKAFQHALQNYEHKLGGKPTISDQSSQLIVFVKGGKAHWAYKINFYADPIKQGALPTKPVYIIDALSFEVYAHWDDIKTLETLNSEGGGFGGNLKMGKLVYDGLENNLPILKIMRDDVTKTCYLKNDEVTVKSYRNRKVETFLCDKTNDEHNHVYWDADEDAVNGGYSPANDALFGGAVIKNMYQTWYGVPVLIENGKPMMLMMIVHDPIDNAYWDGRQMTFGDGVDYFYPLTSLGVAAHEISHGFTEQHSDLVYYGQSGGMNESFSDMAAQAAEFFAYKKNSWEIGPEIFKNPDEALRYMEKPSKDCGNRKPGNWCSIDEMSQYYNGLDVHFSSGIYNRIFYLIGNAKDWNTKKAFDVMVKANMDYWTATSTFAQGACGVLSAAKDLKYDLKPLNAAFKKVGVDTSKC